MPDKRLILSVYRWIIRRRLGPTHEEEQIPWGSYWLKESFKSTIAERLGIEAIPFIVVVDQEGRIAGKNLRDQKLIDKVSELLK